MDPGAEAIVTPIPGINRKNVVGAIEYHLDKDLIKGNHIIITGGGLTGCDLALELAMEGKDVSIIEMGDTLAPGILFINAVSLNRMLDEFGVKQLTNHKVLAFEDNGVMVETKEGEQQLIKADTIINAFGMKPNTRVADEISSLYPLKTRCIGDGVSIGKVGQAVRTGFYAAMSL